MKKLITSVMILSALFVTANPVHAQEEAQAAGKLVSTQPVADYRIVHLQTYLASHNSPLAGVANVFVREADEHGLDWKFVAAIAGVESTFGKHTPQHSFNAWGWGIPTGAQSGVGFTGWEEGIATVSEGLKTNYIDRGATSIEAIGRIYAASPAWAAKVRFFMDKIEEFTPNTPALLDVTI